MAVGLHHLRTFVAVAEERHVSRAAAKLHISQPSVSAQLRYLERALGVRLLHRHPRGVEPTAAGGALLERAREALASFDEALAAARRAEHGETGALTLGLIVGTQVELTSRVIQAFRARHPDVELDVREYTYGEPAAGLTDGEVDAAFVHPPFTHDGLRFETLLEEPRVAVLPSGHPLAGRASIAVAELFGDPWIVADTSDTVCRDFWLAMEHRSEPPLLGPVTRSMDKFAQLALAGRVVGLAEASVAPVFARPGLVFVPVDDIAPVTLALAWRPDTENPAVERLAAVAREVAGG